MDKYKVYVPVLAAFDENGMVIPKQITWEDGTVYEIDKVLDIRQAAATKAGGNGDRYTITINGNKTYLFFERYADFYANPLSANNIGRWFVERKSSPK